MTSSEKRRREERAWLALMVAACRSVDLSRIDRARPPRRPCPLSRRQGQAAKATQPAAVKDVPRPDRWLRPARGADAPDAPPLHPPESAPQAATAAADARDPAGPGPAAPSEDERKVHRRPHHASGRWAAAMKAAALVVGLVLLCATCVVVLLRVRDAGPGASQPPRKPPRIEATTETPEQAERRIACDKAGRLVALVKAYGDARDDYERARPDSQSPAARAALVRLAMVRYELLELWISYDRPDPLPDAGATASAEKLAAIQRDFATVRGRYEALGDRAESPEKDRLRLALLALVDRFAEAAGVSTSAAGDRADLASGVNGEPNGPWADGWLLASSDPMKSWGVVPEPMTILGLFGGLGCLGGFLRRRRGL